MPGDALAASSSSLRFQQKLPIPHDLRAIHPDIEIPSHYINMRGRVPLRPGVGSVGIAEGNVYSGIFLVLKNLPDHVF